MLKIFKSKRALTVFGICVLAASLVFAVLRTISLLFFFEPEIGYYTAGAPLPVIMNILLVIAVLACAALTFIPAVGVSPVEGRENVYTRAVSALIALGFLSFSVHYIISLAQYSGIYAEIPPSYLLCAVASVLSCVFFAVKALNKDSLAAPYVICGIFVVLWFALVLAECYFNAFVQMNAPNKTIFLFACLSAILLAVNEMRIPLGRTKRAFHMFSAALASVLLPFSAIPSTICYFTGNMPLNYTLISYDAIILLLSFLAISRTVQMCFGTEAKISEQVEEPAEQPESEADIDTQQDTTEDPQED